jgi:hypothetical protein
MIGSFDAMRLKKGVYFGSSPGKLEFLNILPTNNPHTSESRQKTGFWQSKWGWFRR